MLGVGSRELQIPILLQALHLPMYRLRLLALQRGARLAVHSFVGFVVLTLS